jgi:hypothetical protein
MLKPATMTVRLGILAICFLCSLSLVNFASGMDIKWTPNQDGGTATNSAPKSQKYWDEHNIERPDYAKTDQEMAMEGGGTNGSSLFKILLIVGVGAAVAYFVVWPSIQHGGAGGGHTLGSSSQQQRSNNLFGAGSTTNSEEAARQARLSRFEQPKKSD